LVGFAAFAGFMAFHLTDTDAIVERSAFLLQFFVALGITIRPLRNLGEQLSRYHESMGALNRNLDLFGSGEKAPRPSQAKQQAPCADFAEVKIENLELRIGEQTMSVDDVALMPGEMTALVGRSGAGKSSVIKCLSGLIEPKVWQANLSWSDFCQKTALVSQYPFLFQGSLRENLAYGSERDISDQEMREMLVAVGLEDILQHQPRPLEQPVSALASAYSGGQLQRLVLARALLRDRSILLLDEVTAALDRENEIRIFSLLRSIATDKKKSILVVTHRLATLPQFDRVWFMQEGSPCVAGAHENLQASNSEYAAFLLANA